MVWSNQIQMKGTKAAAWQEVKPRPLDWQSSLFIDA